MPTNSDSAASTPLEVTTEREKVVGLASGGQKDAVRVSYRQPPTRRWTRFLLIPDEGQPLEELEKYAHDAAVVHATRDWRTPVKPGESPAAQGRLTVREAFNLRYHVPRSQVWKGSRGLQRGNVHLHVKQGEAFEAGRIRRVEGQALCGRSAWYDRVPESSEAHSEADFCARCIEIGTRHDGRLTALVTA